MVFACKEHSKKMPKVAPPPNLSPALALELPTFKWGRARGMRCELTAANGSNNGPEPPASLPETKKKEAAADDREEARAATVASHKGPIIEEGGGEEKRKRKKENMAEFRLTLTKDEINEDFFAISGARPPRRPKRRSKALQSKIELVDMVALQLPTFKWAITRRLRCQLGNDPDGSCNEDGLFSATARPLPLAVVDEDDLMINPQSQPQPQPQQVPVPVPVPVPEPVLLSSAAPNLQQEEQGNKHPSLVFGIKLSHRRAAEEEQEPHSPPPPPPPKKKAKAISTSVDAASADQRESTELIIASKKPEEEGIRIPYTKKELEEDIKAMMSGTDINSRPPRRHRKRRPRCESCLFPGSDLPRLLTLDRYQLKPSISKRKR